MPIYAQLNENNIVINVTSVGSDDVDLDNDQIYINELKSWWGENTLWMQACLVGSIRNIFPGIDYEYIPGLDVFASPKPSEFPSWTLNEELIWAPPIPYPCVYNHEDTTTHYDWDEANLSWYKRL